MGIYQFIVDELGVSCCVSGFEPLDLLRAIYMLTESFEKGEKKLINAYERAVRVEGNTKAKGVMSEVFEAAPADWRGCGVIPQSGLKIKKTYQKYDAEKRFEIDVPRSEENSACICGDILRGSKTPEDCTLFKKQCTPLDPKGACMVSSEGTCAAWYRY